MFSTCPFSTLRFQPRCQHRLYTSHLGNIRSKTSTPFPCARSPRDTTSRPRSWQRHFLIGITIGAVVTPAYLYYTGNTKKPTSFVTYSLARKEPVSSTASIFYLEPKDAGAEFDTYKNAWKKGIWNFRFKQPQIQVVREYTPLPPLDDAVGDGQKQLRFLIRRDPHGEVSSYLHRLPLGSSVEMQGPNLEYIVDPATEKVVFFAGGTGIAPALQIAYAMFADGQAKGQTGGDRKLHIFWANRTREDCVGGFSDSVAKLSTVSQKSGWFDFLRSNSSATTEPSVDCGENQGLLVKELEQLKARYPGNVSVDYFVNEENILIDNSVVLDALSDLHLDDAYPPQDTSRSRRKHILISGPEGFVSYLAGPKEWMNGREEQGKLGGLLGQALAKKPCDVTIWKI